MAIIKGKGTKHVVFAVLKWALLILGLVIMLGPFWWMIISSLKHSRELLQVPPTFWPKVPTLDNYRRVLDTIPFWTYLMNSIWLALVNTVVAVFTSAIIGFVFAKYHFRGKNLIFTAIIAILIVPYQMLMLPLFTLMLNLKWVGTYLVLTVPYFINVFGIFLMRQFMLDIPNELLEAAKLDGCKHFGQFFRIVLPVVKSSIATLFIFLFMENWNSYLWPLIVVNTKKHMTLPVGLGTFVQQYLTKYDLLMAASLMAVIPMIIVFLLAQKKFIEGIAMTGMKG